MKIEIGMNVESYKKQYKGYIADSSTYTGVVVKVNKKSFIVKLTHVLEKHGDDVVVDTEYNVPKVKYTYWYTTESGKIIYKSDSKIYGIIEFDETTEEPDTAGLKTATEIEIAETEPETTEDTTDQYETDIDNFNKKSAINSMYGIASNTSPKISNKYDETKELLAVEQFERLTGTLFKSLLKAIGLEETMRIPIIISNNMVYFNYNGTQYKYNPAQCKVYKNDGRKYQRINWKDFKDDNSSTDQKQDRGRSPPLLLI